MSDKGKINDNRQVMEEEQAKRTIYSDLCSDCLQRKHPGVPCKNQPGSKPIPPKSRVKNQEEDEPDNFFCQVCE